MLDASSRNKTLLNRDKNRRVELIAVGFSQIIDYDHMSLELYNKLTQVQKQYHQREVGKFFNHSLAWFSGMFDAKFVIQGYLLHQTEGSSELQYRKLLIAFSKLLSRRGVSPTPWAKLVYRPHSMDDIPIKVEDVVRRKSNKIEAEVDTQWLADFTINSTF